MQVFRRQSKQESYPLIYNKNRNAATLQFIERAKTIMLITANS